MPTTREPWQFKIISQARREQARAETIARSTGSQKTITREDGRYLYAAPGEYESAREYADAES